MRLLSHWLCVRPTVLQTLLVKVSSKAQGRPSPHHPAYTLHWRLAPFTCKMHTLDSITEKHRIRGSAAYATQLNSTENYGRSEKNTHSIQRSAARLLTFAESTAAAACFLVESALGHAGLSLVGSHAATAAMVSTANDRTNGAIRPTLHGNN